jgi:hypothetical protein
MPEAAFHMVDRFAQIRLPLVKHATQRTLQHSERGWPFLDLHRDGRPVLAWLLGLEPQALRSLCRLFPAGAAGLLQGSDHEECEALRERRRVEGRLIKNRMDIAAGVWLWSGRVPKAIVTRLRETMEARFGNRGRRVEDGFIRHEWLVPGSGLGFRYRLSSAGLFEYEIDVPGWPPTRGTPEIYGLPCPLNIVIDSDIDDVARWLDAWLPDFLEIYEAVRANAGSPT